jgi:methionyl-tRNA formyltransferase
MGTPGFAAEILDALVEYPGGEVVAVYSQPDRPCGRGRACKAPETKTLALEHGIPVYQPLNFKSDEATEALRALNPDVLVVAAYGLILPKKILDIPTHGAMNVHASLLPKYRGASPIQMAIRDGEPVTGVTIMQMDVGMDTGDILLQKAVAIGYEETAQQLHDFLAKVGGVLMVKALEKLKEGTLKRFPQNNEAATHAPKLNKLDGEIDWNRPAEEIHNQVRAMTPWPGAYFQWEMPGLEKSIRLAVAPGIPGDELPEGTAPGTILEVVEIEGKEFLPIACADKAYLVSALTPEGKKSMSPEAFACGYLSRCKV